MWKISLLSLLVCILFVYAYIEKAVEPRFSYEFKMITICMAIIWVVSTAYWIYELRKKSQNPSWKTRVKKIKKEVADMMDNLPSIK